MDGSPKSVYKEFNCGRLKASVVADKGTHRVAIDFEAKRAVCKCNWTVSKPFPFELRQEALTHCGNIDTEYRA